MGYNPGNSVGSSGGAEFAQYPTGGPWPSRPSTAGDVLWVTDDPNASAPGDLASNDVIIYPQVEALTFALSDETTVLSSTGTKLTTRIPFAFKMYGARANLKTASSSGVVTVDVNEAGSSILSTKLTIDQGEKTSVTAAAAYVFSDTQLADDAEITFDIDGYGASAVGLKVTLYGWR